MTAMTPGTGGRDGGHDDQVEQLADELVSYWKAETFVIQTGHGELVLASDTVEGVER